MFWFYYLVTHPCTHLESLSNTDRHLVSTSVLDSSPERFNPCSSSSTLTSRPFKSTYHMSTRLASILTLILSNRLALVMAIASKSIFLCGLLSITIPPRCSLKLRFLLLGLFSLVHHYHQPNICHSVT